MLTVTEAQIINTVTATIPTVTCLLYDVYKSAKRMSVIQI